jgi:hypothetical protein
MHPRMGEVGTGSRTSLGIKVFSATKARDREVLGDVVTDWIRLHTEYELLDKMVLQSSDAEFHCLTIVLFFQDRRTGKRRNVAT